MGEATTITIFQVREGEFSKEHWDVIVIQKSRKHKRVGVESKRRDRKGEIQAGPHTRCRKWRKTE